MSLAALEWLDSRLVYVAVVARASPIIHVLVYRGSENKFYHAYSLNTCSDIPSDKLDEIETVENISYAKMPAEVQLSPDGEFMAVTTFDGEVKVLKMPHIFDPLMLEPSKEEKKNSETESGMQSASSPVQIAQSKVGSQNDLNASYQGGVSTLRPELEEIKHQDLELDKWLLVTIPPKKIAKFKDPFTYVESTNDETASQADLTGRESAMSAVGESREKEPTFQLSKYRKLDLEGGDAGGILVRAKNYPQLSFVRS